MIAKLDPYSDYIAPQELDQFRKGVEREFIGIGIQVSERDGQLQIISPCTVRRLGERVCGPAIGSSRLAKPARGACRSMTP